MALKDLLSKIKEKRSKMGVDTLIIGAAVLTLLLALVFFFEDGWLFGSKGPAAGVAVGKIVTTQNEVKRKIDAGLTWGAVGSADKVYEGDSIFTGDESAAKIQFDGGGELAVDPKSMIVIHTKNSRLEIDLQYGSLQGRVKNNVPLVFNQDGVKKEITSADADVRIVRLDKSHKTMIQVVSGEMKVQNKIVKKDEFVEISANAAPVISKISVHLEAPASGKTLWITPGKTLDFSWTNSAPEQKQFLEISRTTNFEKPLLKVPLTGTKYQMSEEARPTGAFFWRVRPDAPSTMPSAENKLTVFSDLPPTQISPADKAEFKPNPGDPADSKIAVSFSWEDRAGSSEFQIDIASDDTFTQNLVSQKVKSPAFTSAPLTAGTYYWRVQGLHAARTAPPFSKVSSFNVRAGVPPLQAPVITQTNVNYEVPEKILNTVPSNAGELGTKLKLSSLPPVEWTEVENANEFQVEVANNPEFKDAKTEVATEPHFKLGEVTPGNYFVRVRAKSEEGKLSEASAPAQYTIHLPRPRMAPIKTKTVLFTSQAELDNDKDKYHFEMAWKPIPYAAGYELEWGADPEFKLSKTFKSKESSRTIAVNRAMAYVARVRAIDQAGIPLSEYSDAKTAQLTKKIVVPKKTQIIEPVPEPAPIIQAAMPKPEDLPRVPAANSVAGLAMPKLHIPLVLRDPLPQTSLISLESSPTYVNFKWKPVAGATFYTIDIAKDADFSDMIAEVQVKRTSYVFEKPLPEGRVFWRVRYQHGKDYSDWSDVSDITVIYQ